MNISITRSSFWERLSRPRLLILLETLFVELMMKLKGTLLVGDQILEQLKVSGILLVDSTTVTLPDGAAQHFPGTGSAAAVKWHTCIDVLTGRLHWNQITPGRTHDRNCFPALVDLAGKLVIIDLGYWDYSLLQAIEVAQGFYLSRLKSSAVLIVTEVVQGIGKNAIGQSLLSIPIKKKKGSIIELFCNHAVDGSTFRLRVVGFWNPIERKYHWYVTNMEVAAVVIYPLYRLRWQIELMFKGCKQSLNLDGITSGNKNVIKSMVFASLIAQLTSQTILRNSMSQLEEDKKFAVSYQRISNVFANISSRFIPFILGSCKNSLNRLVEKIELFLNELFDPNYRHRRSSLGRIIDVLNSS